MNTLQLEEIMKRDRMGGLYFRGVYAADQFLHQKVNKYSSGYIVNTDPINKEGRHWVAIHIDENGRGEFFCSYGNSPKMYNFDKWLDKNTTSWTFNTKRMQGTTSSVCGHYCVFYLLHRFRKISLTCLQNMFTEDYALNDILVNNFICERFDLHTPVSDEGFITQQIARTLQSYFAR